MLFMDENCTFEILVLFAANYKDIEETQSQKLSGKCFMRNYEIYEKFGQTGNNKSGNTIFSGCLSQTVTIFGSPVNFGSEEQTK